MNNNLKWVLVITIVASTMGCTSPRVEWVNGPKSGIGEELFEEENDLAKLDRESREKEHRRNIARSIKMMNDQQTPAP